MTTTGRAVERRLFSGIAWLVRNLEEVISSAALITIVAAVCWGVITRYLVHEPATWTSEVASIAFAWVVFPGAAAVFKHGGHISIDILVAFVAVKARYVIEKATESLIIAFCIYVVILATKFAVLNWDIPTSVLRIPVSVSYLAVTVGFALMAVRQTQAIMSGQSGQRAAD